MKFTLMQQLIDLLPRLSRTKYAAMPEPMLFVERPKSLHGADQSTTFH